MPPVKHPHSTTIEFNPSTLILCRLARCQLGNKYGAEAEDVGSLLAAAARLGLQVDGVSFHVGSGASNPDAFTEVRLLWCCGSSVLNGVCLFLGG